MSRAHSPFNPAPLVAMVLFCALATADGAETGLSPARLFNAGNANLREGRIGEAILNYERASFMAPNDPDIQANLRLARSKAGLWSGERPLLDRLAHKASLSTWAKAIAVALFCAAASLPLMLLLPRARSLWLTIRVLAAMIAITAGAAMAIAWHDMARAVTIAKESATRVAPAAAAGVAFHLREGETVRLIKSHGDFSLVENRDGRRAWAKRAEVTPIIPR